MYSIYGFECLLKVIKGSQWKKDGLILKVWAKTVSAINQSIKVFLKCEQNWQIASFILQTKRTTKID